MANGNFQEKNCQKWPLTILHAQYKTVQRELSQNCAEQNAIPLVKWKHILHLQFLIPIALSH